MELKKEKKKQPLLNLIAVWLVCGLTIGILYQITFKNYNCYGCNSVSRLYVSQAKHSLYNIYLYCKDYWVNNGTNANCTKEIWASINDNDQYLYEDVKIHAIGNSENFTGYAVHTHDEDRKVFEIDSMGLIQEIPKSFVSLGSIRETQQFIFD